MRIIYTQNPLASKIILDELEIEKLRYKVVKDTLYNKIVSIKYHLLSGGDIETEFDKLFNGIENDQCEVHPQVIDAEVQHSMKYLLESATESHCGDCTCVAMSCTKCELEDKLGINLAEGLYSHHASYIADYFHDNPDATAQDCVDEFKNNEIIASEAWHTPDNLKRWNKERKQSMRWMQDYIVKYPIGEEITL